MFKLKNTIGSSSFVDAYDVKNTKSILRDWGYYPRDKDIHGFTDNELFDGIKKFQSANNLKIDGIMQPNGETEKKMSELVSFLKEPPIPELKPEMRNQPIPPIPQRKPDIPESDEEAMERLKEKISKQKKLIDYLKKGKVKAGPPLLYEIQKRAWEIMNDKVI